MIPSWKRFAIHLPIGIIAALLLLVHSYGCALSLSFVMLFVVYELNEADKAYIDIQGAIAGIPMGALIVWVLTL